MRAAAALASALDGRRLGWAVVLIAVGVVATQSPFTLLLLVLDGLPAAAIFVAAYSMGRALLGWIHILEGEGLWEHLLAVGVGVGLISNLVLALGVFGVLSRVVWIVTLGVFVVTGVVQSLRSRREVAAKVVGDDLGDGVGDDIGVGDGVGDGDGERRFRLLLLLVGPFLGLLVLVAATPPGFLWMEEGAGYDVLEYHLQLPKEYFEFGRVAYRPHNVYSGFPANVEMLYLLCMVLTDDPYTGAAAGKWLNAGLIVAAVAAMSVAVGAMAMGAMTVGSDRLRRRASIGTAVVGAGVGWFVYLGGIAYVEGGMLFFGALALGVLIRGDGDKGVSLRSAALAGVLAGLACGCKYTGVILVAIPLGVGAMILARGGWGLRVLTTSLFAIAAIGAMGPWLVKNAVETGDPVFPLGYRVFGAEAEGWSLERAAHFASSHEPDSEAASLGGRFGAVWERILGDPAQRFGALVFMLAGARVIDRRRDRVDLALFAILVAQWVLWMIGTHLYSRFAVPMALPLALLAGRALGSFEGKSMRRAAVGLTIAGSLLNLMFAGRLYAEHLYPAGEKIPIEGMDSLFLEGRAPGHEHLAVINDRSFPADARLLMVGDAKAYYFRRRVDYSVVFNRNPFADAVRAAGSDEGVIRWLAERGYTHVFVHWGEIQRLRSSRYGFDEAISPALFEGLEAAGLTMAQVFRAGGADWPYGAIYRVPSSNSMSKAARLGD